MVISFSSGRRGEARFFCDHLGYRWRERGKDRVSRWILLSIGKFVILLCNVRSRGFRGLSGEVKLAEGKAVLLRSELSVAIEVTKDL